MDESVTIEPLTDDPTERGPEADDWAYDGTSDYEPSLAESVFGSISSSVAAHVYEYGRRYGRFGEGQYPLPNDEEEQFREQLRHDMLKELLEGKLFLADIGPNPQKVIDIGTGFGHWAIDMAETYPSSEVIGVDLSPVQPVWVPPNLEFRIDNVEEGEWKHGSNYDYFHLRYTMIVLRNQHLILDRIFEHLKPGGWFETQDIYCRISCDDATMPADYAPNRFYKLMNQVFLLTGLVNIFFLDGCQQALERAGFVNVRRKVFHVPIGEWPRDPKLRIIGVYMRECMVNVMQALSARPFEEAHVDRAEAQALLKDANAALYNRRIHAYVPVSFVWAQKPLNG